MCFYFFLFICSDFCASQEAGFGERDRSPFRSDAVDFSDPASQVSMNISFSFLFTVCC